MALKKKLMVGLLTIAVICIVFAGVITRDGQVKTPEGAGMITLDAGQFEAFPLPDYAAQHVTDEYKSYLSR